MSSLGMYFLRTLVAPTGAVDGIYLHGYVRCIGNSSTASGKNDSEGTAGLSYS